MTTATAKKPAVRKPAAGREGRSSEGAEARSREGRAGAEAEAEPKTLVEALSTGQATLRKVRQNGTQRSLPYLAVGTEGRKQAEAVTVDAIIEALKVSTATARRFITHLARAHAVEAGERDGGWKPGTREVVVHTVVAKQPKA